MRRRDSVKKALYIELSLKRNQYLLGGETRNSLRCRLHVIIISFIFLRNAYGRRLQEVV